MALPNSLSKLKNLGAVEEDYTISDVTFTLRSITSKEHMEIVGATSVVADDILRLELMKQKTLQFAIKTVDGQAVDNEDLLKYLSECNPHIINHLFTKYLDVANKAAELVQEKVEKIELADTNLPDITGATKDEKPQDDESK